MVENSSGQLVASRNELTDLLRFCGSSFCKNLYFVLDGVDECGESVALIRGLSQLSQHTAPKVIFFSRPNVAALNQLSSARHLQIGRSTSPDISHFLTRKLNVLIGFGLLPKHPNRLELVDRLVLGADGMFLWARLMIEYLNSAALCPNQRINIIMDINFPEGLEIMYRRIWDLICQGKKAERDLAKWIIKWLIFAMRTLTCEELKDSLAVMNPESTRTAIDFPNFEKAVGQACASLVELVKITDLRHETSAHAFRLCHLSAREYFTNDSYQADHCFPIADSNLDISRSCLQYLTFSVPAQPLSEGIDSETALHQLDSMFPFYHYALSNWLQHLQQFRFHARDLGDSQCGTAMKSTFCRLQIAFARFLSQKLVQSAWIEASYLFEGATKFKGIADWVNWVTSAENPLRSVVEASRQIYCDATEYSQYLEELERTWGPQLLKAPHLIWEEITAFTPSRMVTQTTTTRVDTLVSDAPLGNRVTLSGKPLCKISAVSTDGHSVAILSIWPCK